MKNIFSRMLAPTGRTKLCYTRGSSVTTVSRPSGRMVGFYRGGSFFKPSGVRTSMFTRRPRAKKYW